MVFLVSKVAAQRSPDFTIGDPDDPYLMRWFIVPRNRIFNIYLHRFLRSDHDFALHDHPWWNASWLLDGNYIEVVPLDNADPSGLTISKYRSAGELLFRRADQAHRVQLHVDGTGRPRPVWTLFLTGPKLREWGFWCPAGWKHWKKFVKNAPGSREVGVGCDD